jgi:hypothetical protein
MWRLDTQAKRQSPRSPKNCAGPASILADVQANVKTQSAYSTFTFTGFSDFTVF